MLNKLKQYFFKFSICLLFIVCYENCYIDYLIICINLLFIEIFVYVLKDFKRRFHYGIYVIVFYIFYMGRIFAQEIFGLSFSKWIDISLENCYESRTLLLIIFISLLSFDFTFRFFNHKINKEIYIHRNVYISKKVNSLILKFIYITFIIKLLVLIERVYFVSYQGYVESYVNFNSSIPLIFHRISSLFLILITFYLSVLPDKKQSFRVFILYGILGIISLGTGQRNEFFKIAIFIILYLGLRNSYFNYNKIWLYKKHIVYVILSTPFLLIFSVWFGSYRSNQSFELSLFDSFLWFFYSQGNSAKLIMYTIEDSDIFINSNYLLGPIISFFSESLILDPFNVLADYNGQTAEFANSGRSFDAKISYHVLGDAYLNGAGLGSASIVELWVDYSYAGVIAGSILYGFLLAKFIPWFKENYIKRFFALLFIIPLIYSSRDTYFTFLIPLLSFTNMIMILLLFKNFKEKRFRSNEN